MSMRIIFECETEIGKCSDDLIDNHILTESGAENWTLYAHTVASVTGSKGMLKIEQRCFLRRGEEIPDQSWVKPEIILEPVLSAEAEMKELVRKIHERFIQNALPQLPENLLVPV
jgi:hypothetical protein